MAKIPVQDVLDGGTPTFQPGDSEGDTFVNDGRTILKVIGPNAGYKVVFANARNCSFGCHPPYRVVAPANQPGLETPTLDPFRFNFSGQAHVSYEDKDGVASAVGIQVAAVRYSQALETECEE